MGDPVGGRAIHRLALGWCSPFSDANKDGLCDILDILAANAKLFGAPTYCERYPPPP